jgi:hypothetical protein
VVVQFEISFQVAPLHVKQRVECDSLLPPFWLPAVPPM